MLRDSNSYYQLGGTTPLAGGKQKENWKKMPECRAAPEASCLVLGVAADCVYSRRVCRDLSVQCPLVIPTPQYCCGSHYMLKDRIAIVTVWDRVDDVALQKYTICDKYISIEALRILSARKGGKLSSEPC